MLYAFFWRVAGCGVDAKFEADSHRLVRFGDWNPRGLRFICSDMVSLEKR